MKVGIACAFRHDPVSDGRLIPASTVIPRQEEDFKKGLKLIAPIMGYLAASHNGKTFWSFIKYEAPERWHAKWNKASHGANLATCGVGEIACQECEQTVVYPLHGGGADRTFCPCCGNRHPHIEVIKPTGKRYSEMLDASGLRTQLESAAAAAASDPAEPAFEFPTVLVGGSNVPPSASVAPDIQGAAQAVGRGLKPLSEFAVLDELGAVKDGDLSIVPGVFSGVLDEDEVRDGHSWTHGLVQSWVKLCLPKAPVAPFTNFRY